MRCWRVGERAARQATVTISVASLIPGSTPAAIKEFENQVKQFEKANPDIKVKPVEYQWTGPTFAAKLAARTLPTVFEVPFTDAKTLGERGQLADLTREIKALPYFSKLNPTVLAEATTSSGKIVALPEGRVRAGAPLQPQAVPAGRARPEQAADDLGAGARLREADRGADRQGRLPPDGEGGQHRRLDPDDDDVLARRSHAVRDRQRTRRRR